MEQNSTPNQQTAMNPIPVARPNEQSTLNIDDFVRIYDPNSDQIFVEKRS